MTECQSIFVTKHGVPDVLKLKSDSLKEPIIGEVCVKIKYSGINFADIMGRMGLYPTAPNPPYVPGFEIAGIIEKTGDDSTKSLVGRAIVGLSRFHGYSTHTNVPLNQLFFINEKWLDVAAAIPVNYLTAYFMMVHQAAVVREDLELNIWDAIVNIDTAMRGDSDLAGNVTDMEILEATTAYTEIGGISFRTLDIPIRLQIMGEVTITP